MTFEDDFYLWNPTSFLYKDPDHGVYIGNVVGNTSMEDQLKVVEDAGNAARTDIQNAGFEQATAIGVLAGKFVSLWRISDGVIVELSKHFGESFILDSSRLDAAVIGLSPVIRKHHPELIEQAISEVVSRQQAERDNQNTPNDTDSSEIPECDAEFYQFAPVMFLVKDPDTSGYFGNVVGNTSLQDLLQGVYTAGNTQKDSITDISLTQIEEIRLQSEKYRSVAAIHKNAMREILTSLPLGGIFVLDASVLDGTPLG